MTLIADSSPAVVLTSGSDVAVRIARLSHTYRDRKALDDVSLDVDRGKIFGLLGPNGSGKTTLFRILSTLITPQDGSVTIRGLDLARQRDAIRAKIGVVFQSPALDRQLTARENLACQGALYGLKGSVLQHRIDTLLSRVNLLDRANERVDRYSGGMRRRVEIAKGLLHQPEVLILDEPSTGLDPGARLDMWDLLQDVRSTGVTILLTTHLMEEADKCDRLAILDQGRLLATDSPASLKQKIRGDVITLTSQKLAELEKAIETRLAVRPQRVGDALRLERAAGHEFLPAIFEAAPGLIDSVSVGRPSLEDVFVQLTGRVYRDHADNGSSSA